MATEMNEANEATQEAVAVWLRNPKTGMVNLVVHPETIRRCLSEGHVQVSDPRLPSVDAPPETPTTPPPLDADAVAARDQAIIAAAHERNTAAREAFGVTGSSSPAPGTAEKRKPTRAHGQRGE